MQLIVRAIALALTHIHFVASRKRGDLRSIVFQCSVPFLKVESDCRNDKVAAQAPPVIRRIACVRKRESKSRKQLIEDETFGLGWVDHIWVVLEIS